MLKKIKITVECEGHDTEVYEGNTVLLSVADCPEFSAADSGVEIKPQCVVQGDYLGLCRLVTHQAMHVACIYHDMVEKAKKKREEAKQKLEDAAQKAEETEPVEHIVKTKGRAKK